jgi:RNA polymerase sigma factor (sigma-70 family)
MLTLANFTKGPVLSNEITMSSGLENDEELMGTGERDDTQLLRAYARGDEQAFESLVKRYFGLVHAVILRRVEDPSLAEEATQSTFIILAHKARKLANGVLLRGWLLRTARFVSNDALKSQRRRQEREQPLEIHSNELAESEANSVGVREVLEQAILSLPAAEQAGVVARFYEGRSFKEVASVLEITEDGAQKKISRSLKKLRHFLSRRGMKTSDAVFSGALWALRVPPLPQHLVHTSVRQITAAVGGKLVGGLATNLAGRCLQVLARREWVILGGRVLLVLLVLAGGGWASWSLSRGAGAFRPNPQMEALGKGWSAIVLKVAAAKQTFQRIPGPNDPDYQAYTNQMQLVVDETPRIMMQVQAALKPAEEREQMAEFLTVELRETLGLDTAQQGKLFNYMREGLSKGATLKEAMKAMAQSTPAEAGEIKANLSRKQRQEFDRVYGADGLCLFQYLTLATAAD